MRNITRAVGSLFVAAGLAVAIAPAAGAATQTPTAVAAPAHETTLVCNSDFDHCYYVENYDNWDYDGWYYDGFHHERRFHHGHHFHH